MSETPILNRSDVEAEPTDVGDHDPFGRTPPGGPDRPATPLEPPATPGARGWIAGAVAAAVLATGGFFGVKAVASHTKSAASTSAGSGPGGFFGGAPGGGAGRGGLVGTIKSIDGSSLVVTTASGSNETVTTSAATTATEATTGSLSDIKAGDHVAVVGSGTPTITAASIIDSGANAAAAGPGFGGPPPGGQGGPGGPPGAAGGGQFGGTGVAPAFGTVVDVGPSHLTVAEADGTHVSVTTSSSTTVTTMRTIAVSDLAVGQAVTVRGTTANGAVTATAIQEAAGAFG